MREIMFRAWDKEEKVMCIVKQILNFKDNMHFILDNLNSDVWGNNYGCDKNRIELMQYTGFNDKKAKRIYEGDIIRCWGGEFCQGFWEHDEKITVDNIANPFTMLGLTESENIEVIGNIYENPELLGSD